MPLEDRVCCVEGVLSSECPLKIGLIVYGYCFYYQGIVDVLCEACEQLKWKVPTKIQREALPVALEGLLVYHVYGLILIISRRRRRPGDGRYCNAPRLSVCPSVCLSVRHVYFSHCNSKTHCCIFSKLCRYVHQVMGVCCIVFDIDGMLFEFFMNFLNI